jgi:hypothetical protein
MSEHGSREPQSINYIRRWLRENRPDQAASFEEILSKSFAYQRGLIKDPTATTLMFMATVGFEAGKLCQKENLDDSIQQ